MSTDKIIIVGAGGEKAGSTMQKVMQAMDASPELSADDKREFRGAVDSGKIVLVDDNHPDALVAEAIRAAPLETGFRRSVHRPGGFIAGLAMTALSATACAYSMKMGAGSRGSRRGDGRRLHPDKKDDFIITDSQGRKYRKDANGTIRRIK